MTGDSYSTAELMEQAGITRQQVSYWMLHGWIEPTTGVGQGQGIPLFWSHANVRQACRMAKVVRAGVAPQVAAQVAALGRWSDGDVTITLKR